MSSDFAVIGGGIVGLATARALGRNNSGAKIVVLEKEPGLALHQTGRNSGVIHSGIYYKPGSFKAEFSKKGRTSMVEFCRGQGIPHDLCGKLIVATEERELPLLAALLQRGLQNGLAVERLTPEQAKKIEPHVNCLAAVRVPETGITDYRQVSEKMAHQVHTAGGEVLCDCRVIAIVAAGQGYALETTRGRMVTRNLVNCCGLQSDRVAKLAGIHLPARIVPFRGEYYQLAHAKRGMVKHLIYPVPNPDFPFLGVHFTRMIDGSVHAGPNAVLALKREGYRWSQFSPQDLFETLTFPGFWKLATKNLGAGSKEVVRSLSRRAFLHSLQRLIPELHAGDIEPSPAGVRAQALTPDGVLVDDFMIIQEGAAVHVLNAPSPAATCSLEIGEWIAGKVTA